MNVTQLGTLKGIQNDRPLTHDEMIAIQWAISLITKMLLKTK